MPAKAKTTRYQKFVKSEKNKVKLKNKKELPKGTNITDTKFKVKKILIRDKRKDFDPNDNKTIVPINEILSKLRHFNDGVRSEALGSLTRYLNSQSAVDASESTRNILLALVPLVLDRDRNVRRESFKVIHAVFSPLSAERIEPFFNIAVSYLRCAMTHVDTRIHEDSLQYFDVLLLCAPTLLAENFHVVLPNFMDMISKLRIDSKPGRTLSVNLGSKMTSAKWRSKVLSRLHQFLALYANRKIKIDRSSHTVNPENVTNFFDEKKDNFFPIYRRPFQCKLSCFFKRKTDGADSHAEFDRVKSYIDSLMPLLFETWLEVRPDSINNSGVESIVSEETSQLLEYILEIIMLFWNIIASLENEFRNFELSKWFINEYRVKFSDYFLNNFPYKTNPTLSDKKNRPKDRSDSEGNCHAQNLMIVHICVLLHNNAVTNFHNGEILLYIRENLQEICNGEFKIQKEFLTCMREILSLENFSNSSEIIGLLDAIILMYCNGDLQKSFKQNLFEMLCVILKKDDLNALKKFNSFNLWLNELANILIRASSLTVDIFDIILQFAIRHNELFNTIMKTNINEVLTNIPKITLTGGDKGIMGRKMISLLYWIRCWDNSSLNIIQEQLSTNAYSSDDKEFLIEILKIRLEGIYSY